MTEYLEKTEFDKFVKNDFTHLLEDVIKIKVNQKWIIWLQIAAVGTLIANFIRLVLP
jgi:hypothetical protein